MAFYDKQKSLVKLELELQNGYETWYSALNDDKQGIIKATRSLRKRIIEKRHQGNVINAVFYNNQTGAVIEGEPNKYSKSESVFKMVVFTDYKKLVFYSNIGETTPDELIKQHLPFSYQTALVYTNPHAGYNNEVVAKFIRGKRVQ